MKLHDWLEQKEITAYRFAVDNGIRHTYMSKIKKGMIPGRELMEKIYRATNGEVTPNDFYGTEEWGGKN